MVALSFEGDCIPNYSCTEKTSHNLQKQKVISYNATNTMIRNRKACMTAAIPVSFVLQEVNYMKKKNNTLSIRLTNNELDTININSRRLQMSNSEYLRSLIHNAVPAAVDYRQDIVPVSKQNRRLSPNLV